MRASFRRRLAAEAVEAGVSLRVKTSKTSSPVRPDLGLEKAGPTGLAPGEHVEETAQRPAVRGTQAVEDLHGPPGRADLGEPPGGRSREPLRASAAA